MKRRMVCILVLLVMLLGCSGCEEKPAPVAKPIGEGRIETVGGIFIDTEEMTLTFGVGSYILCDGQKIDVSGTVHDIDGMLGGAKVYFHPGAVRLSTVRASYHFLLGTLPDGLDLDRGQVYMDGELVDQAGD